MGAFSEATTEAIDERAIAPTAINAESVLILTVITLLL
jgi:hypothetical protein